MDIGFDIDDCVTQTAQTFCQYSNQLFNNNLTIDLLDSTSAKFEDTGLITPKQVKKIKKEYYKDRIFRAIKAYPDSIQTIKQLTKHNVYFITNRDDYALDELEEDTKFWFKHNGIENYRLIFTQDKQKIINELNLDMFVEDNILQVKSILTTSKLKIIIPIRPWNKSSQNLIKNALFVKDWGEINYQITHHDSEN